MKRKLLLISLNVLRLLWAATWTENEELKLLLFVCYFSEEELRERQKQDSLFAPTEVKDVLHGVLAMCWTSHRLGLHIYTIQRN